MYIIRFVLLPFAVTLISPLVLTLFVRHITRSTGLLDKPGRHKQHEAPTPTLGGISVFLSFVIGCALSGPLSPQLKVILQTASVLVLVGLFDDLRGVSANVKLSALALATWCLWMNGIHLNVFGASGLFSLLVTFLWIGLVASAFNGVDNADGAASGLALISCCTTFAISWVTWQHDLAVISLVLAGSCLGFLAFNYPRPKATIFLGDSGSLFLGFCLAVLVVLGEWSQTGWQSGVIAGALVIVPLADFCFILLSRGFDGRYRRWDDPIKMCARDHTFHRLRAAGLGGEAALWVMYVFAAIYGVLAFLAVRYPERFTLWLAVQWLTPTLLLYILLKQVRLSDDAFPAVDGH